MYQLTEFGLPFLYVTCDEEIYDSRTGNYYHINYDTQITCFDMESHKSYKLIFAKIYGYYFNSPWSLGIDHRWLGPIEFSNYFAVIDGRIWSNNCHKYLSPLIDKDGYLRVQLTRDNGKTHNLSIHRLVATIYIPNPENKPIVNHIDHCVTNNHVSNLEWCTDKENNDHARNFGNAKKSVTDEQVHEVCKLLALGYTGPMIESLTGISRWLVKNIRRGSGHRAISQQYVIPNSWMVVDPYKDRFSKSRNDTMVHFPQVTF